MWRMLVALGGVVAALWAAAPALAEPWRIGVQGSARSFGAVNAIGDFRPRQDPSPGAAFAVFGQPASQRSLSSGSACKMVWPALGLRILFANFGGGGACHREFGKSQTARVLGRSEWHTARGLHIGDRVRRLRRLYPRARRHARAWWLVTGVSLYGPGRQRYPVLAAVVRDGRVSSFKLWIGAAGD